MSSQSGAGGAEGSLAWLWGPGILALGYHLHALDPRLTGFVFPRGHWRWGTVAASRKVARSRVGMWSWDPCRPRAIALSQLLCRAFL